jgi:putative ABC transport system permease protein
MRLPLSIPQFVQDTRYGARALGRSPAFTAAAVATLAITIAANTTMLSVIEQVLLRPLPFAEARQLHMIVEGDGKGSFRAASYLTFLDWQRQSQTLSGIAFMRGNGGLLRRPDGPERVAYAAVTPGFFAMLGARPLIGRTFLPQEERGESDDVAVLSYELWRSHFGADRAIVGQTIAYDSSTLRVVGVMPPGATWPEWVSFWRPLTGRLATDPALANRNFHVDSRILGRVKPGTSIEQVQAEFGVIQTRLAAAYPGESAGWVTGVFFPLRDSIVGDAGSMLLLLGGCVGVVLLIACANISNLSLVRAITREREMAIRKTLGASGGRLARQLLTESALLGFAAGTIALILSAWAIRAIRTAAPPNVPRVVELSADWRVFAVALALSLLVALLVGVQPMLRVRSDNFAEPLRQGRQGGPGVGTRRLRSVLSIAQLALATALLLGGGLLMQSFRRMQQVDLGFDSSGVLGFTLWAPQPGYRKAEDAMALYQRVLGAIQAVPGVESVGLSNFGPGSGVPTQIVVPGRGAETRSTDVANYKTVSAEYFRAMRMSMVKGRGFTEASIKSPDDGIVISESVARKYWPGRDPVGEAITIFGSSQARPDYGKPQPSHVIGVVRDVRTLGTNPAEPAADVYVPYTRAVWPRANLVIRSSIEPVALIPALKRAVLSVDPAIPVAGSLAGGGFSAVGRGFTPGLSTRRYLMWLLSGFAVSALALALVGVYGVISYGVTQRTPEFGVRLALGAPPSQLFRMILRQGAQLALFGVATGAVCGGAAARALNALLYNTSPADTATYAVVSTAVMATVLVACAIPAMRASRVDPSVALRGD